MNVIELSQRIGHANTIKEIEVVLSDLTNWLELDFYSFALLIPLTLNDSEAIIFNNYPENWMEHYFEQQYLHRDPVIKYVGTSSTPIKWQDFHKNRKVFSKQDSNFMFLAGDFGLKHGISFPCHGTAGESGVFGLVSRKPLSALQELNALTAGLSLLPFLLQAVRRIHDYAFQSKIQLTGREKQCLFWASEGKTGWEIAKILSITERTVLYHIDNAIKKTDSTTRQQAIVKAILTGQITPRHRNFQLFSPDLLTK